MRPACWFLQAEPAEGHAHVEVTHNQQQLNSTLSILSPSLTASPTATRRLEQLTL